jgi:ATP-dependent Clp protease ATP-binding subunit ClpX
MKYIQPQDLKSFGLIPELIGRLPVLTHLDPLDRTALRRILTEPKNSLIRQQKKLFKMDDIELTFEEDALDYIVDKAVEFKLGARGLRSIVEDVMQEAQFDAPSSEKKQIRITKDYIMERLARSERLAS